MRLDIIMLQVWITYYEKNKTKRTGRKWMDVWVNVLSEIMPGLIEWAFKNVI